jgi:hypothetical protein
MRPANDDMNVRHLRQISWGIERSNMCNKNGEPFLQTDVVLKRCRG